MSAQLKPTFRFAPSPTGYLHVGHALSALIGHAWARRLGGRFILRIEDTDITRARKEYVQAIFDDLEWLGLTWEEPVWLQSQRLDIYKQQQDRLTALGLLYPCFATRAEITQVTAGLHTTGTQTAVDPDGAPVYPGIYKGLDPHVTAQRIARGDTYALRLDMDRALSVARERLALEPLAITRVSLAGSTESIAINPGRWGDVVITRKDTGTSYHIAGVLDDAMQGVTHVCRGRDLEAATDIHRLLQVLLGLPSPIYHHHELVLDKAGRKLSKSAHDTSLASLRGGGWTPAQILEHLTPQLARYLNY